MKRAPFTRSILWSITVVGLIGLEATLVHAQNEILFLHLRLQDDTIRLVASNIRPGVLKKARDFESVSGIEYQFRSSAGVLLWRGVADDPSIRHYEFEDTLQPGRVVSKEFRLKDIEFTVRAPFKEGMDYVEFYRIGPSAGSPNIQNNIRTSLGVVEIRPKRSQ